MDIKSVLDGSIRFLDGYKRVADNSKSVSYVLLKVLGGPRRILETLGNVQNLLGKSRGFRCDSRLARPCGKAHNDIGQFKRSFAWGGRENSKVPNVSLKH